MREGSSTSETWPFECLRCLRMWEEDYLVRRGCDEHGHHIVVWTRDGDAVPPPWSGMTCPGCGCGTVTTFPTGYLAFRPEDAPRLPVAEPPVETAPVETAPVEAPASEAQARGTPYASHALLPLALLLTGSLLYETITAH